ncbi:hypothetical protein Aperf_G00000099909 [Anoplocephala perfoliata]
MASEILECMFCKENFSDQAQFWTHMSKGSCQEDSNIGVGKGTSSKVSPSLTKSDPDAEKVLASMSSLNINGIDNSNSQPLETNGPKPASGLPLPLAPTNSLFSRSERNNSQNSLFTKRELPSIDSLYSSRVQPSDVSNKFSTTESTCTFPRSSGNGSFNEDRKSQLSNCSMTETLSQQPSAKWKCILCNIEFNEKAGMISHVKSSEHEARISINGYSGNTPPRNGVEPKITPTTIPVTNISNTLKKEDFTEMVREIIKQELPAMLRRELGSIFEAFLKTINDRSERPSPCSSPVETNVDLRYIRMQGTSIRCEACDCLINSAAVLPVHVEGKRHKANVAALK